MDHILELNNVSKTFSGSGFTLDNISFSLPSGTIMGFVGENGAGKTTTIGCILNTIAKDTGSIRLFGRELSDSDSAIKENIGVVYDGDNFPSYLNPLQLGSILSGLYSQWDNTMYRDYLIKFQLPEKQKLKTYSKGMTMKLALAAALSHNPKLLILDEATSGLDPVMRDDILDVFLEFVQEEDHSILLSSHITSDLEKIADYIVFIRNGRIILSAPKNDLIYHYGAIRCNETQLSSIDPADIVAYRKSGYQFDVLVADLDKAGKKYKNTLIDHVSIDEIMLILVKGKK